MICVNQDVASASETW